MAKRKNKQLKLKAEKKAKGEATTEKQQKKEEHEEEEDAEQPIPVTILSGFLGSGKTSVLKHILTSKDHKLKVAVIVNDMAELNIDGQTILRTNHVVKSTKKEVVTLQNGCICCTLRGDLIREINRIQQLKEFDYVLIESTGIAEPQQVAESFCVDPDTQELAGIDDQMLLKSARLDTCVTVVDALNFSTYLSSLKRFQDTFRDGLDDAEEKEGEKSISELMVEQVEFANVIILNKTDLVSDDRLQTTMGLLKSLNPKARLISGVHGKIDLKHILNTQLFNMQEASESPGWLVSLKDGVNATEGEADEYGVTSFIYRARKPFHPYRLHQFLRQFFCFADKWAVGESTEDTTVASDESKLEDKYGSILRSKGTCWIAGRDDHEIDWAQSGRIIQLTPNAAWYCKTPPEEWDGVESEEDRKMIEAKFQGFDEDSGKEFTYQYFDRRQEIVVIGTNLQQAAIEEGLNGCLLNEMETKNHTACLPLGTYPDPLHPILVSSGGAQSLFLIARPGQNQHIYINPGSVLTLQNLALNITDEDWEENIRAVKVWLDKTDSSSQGVLLATLRPTTLEQHAVNLSLLPCDKHSGEDVTNRRVRVEVIPRRKLANLLQSKDLMMACEVHIMGKFEPIPYSESLDDDHDDDDDDDDEEDDILDKNGEDDIECIDGMCPY